MATVRTTLDPLHPQTPSEAEAARMDAMTDAEVTAGAEADPDNPPFTEAELARVRGIRAAKAARAATGLGQEAFAVAFHIKLGRLRDLEQGRFTPDAALVAYLQVIAADPSTALRALAA